MAANVDIMTIAVKSVNYVVVVPPQIMILLV